MSPAILEVQVRSLRRQLERLESAISREGRPGERSSLADFRGAWKGRGIATEQDLDDARLRLPHNLGQS